MEGPQLPEGLTPRRIAVVSHAPHLVKVLHMMGKFKDRIPENKIIQPFPLPTPVRGVREYAQMELQGTLAAIYKLNTASATPHRYQL